MYFRGPLQRTGWPQGIRIDISTGDPLAFPSARRTLDHPYSDRQFVATAGLHLRCYDLREVLLEKLRGLAGQRSYAIARDLYDVHWLLDQAGLSVADVVRKARAKFAAKGVELSPRMVHNLKARRDELQNDWARSVERLVPGERHTGFDAAWTTSVEALTALVERGRT